MNKIIFGLLLFSLSSCSQRENNSDLQKAKSVIVVDSDSLLINSMMKQQKFNQVKTKIDSIMPLKPLNQQGYYYYQKGFSDLMLQNHKEAISNFEQAVSLGFRIKASRAMIITAKKMQETYAKYN
ncbi:hypothetical protein TH53_18740 [Pedobacter lusitanus]|uniref:Tetratricopeptide repeat protein n=1 Tax=Pedobacter lusitanus TaxID=1503925 RepID=A0A0D0F2H1_9SPHI|nr:hypothetical protein [Pedobacter lusitanus]KIO75758.1 hypothetical protein TH53_18740 [Pedobacter lusitanus]